MPSLLSRGHVFARREDGTTAMIFALLCVPLMGFVGIAVDGVRWYHGRQVTSEAVDAALLMGARKMQLNASDEAGAISAAMTYYQTNKAGRMSTHSDTIGFELVDNKSAIAVTGEASMKTTLLAVVGIHELSLFRPQQARGAKATFLTGMNAGTSIELSMVLDFTSSMCDGAQASCSNGVKVQGLRDAAKELVDIVVNDNQSQYTSRVALVPFTTRIRLAEDTTTSTITQAITGLPSTWTGYIQECASWTHVSGSGGEGNEIWTCNGSSVVQRTMKLMPCVTERIYDDRWDAQAYLDYTDDAPGSNRWIMGHGGDRMPLYRNSTDSSAAPSGYGQSSGNPGSNWNYDTNSSSYCSEAPEANVVVPLSSNKSMLKTKIDDFSAAGATAGPLGLGFGWFTLSPKWSGVWPVASLPGPYSETRERNAAGVPVLRKVAVIMTDGVFNTMRGSKGLDTVKIADHARQTCTKMKDEGIEIYTVGFALDQLSGAARTTAEDMLKACGTSVRHFYSTLNVDQLKIAFRDIALKVTPVRLTQ